jgi:hypothetical protein
LGRNLCERYQDVADGTSMIGSIVTNEMQQFQSAAKTCLSVSDSKDSERLRPDTKG